MTAPDASGTDGPAPEEERVNEPLTSAALDECVRAIEDALDTLPAALQSAARECQIECVGAPSDEECYGLYEPLPEWGNVVRPSARIRIFAHALWHDFPDPAERSAQLAVTLIHELGHHLGLDESEVIRAGWA